MKTKERIFHALLFEALALILLISLASLLPGQETSAMTGLAIALSVIAMAWNYIYNVIFDRFFPGDRLERSFKLRLGHGLGFEGGMILASFPVIMWVTKMSFWTVFMLDIGAVVFFIIYAIAYNWAYDVIKHKYWPKQEPQGEAS
ncbi:membrane protein [Marinomonas sp. SBI22]|uniref:PACE efflux transporter n=1 Tax=unclassified Marinomonas TaxID=196814 RepID=UPI0007AEFA9A|nr:MULTISPECIES: PACE efflux transporter [unclassified Marinomonas]KZM40462.1 membrane protein [Marinomonas sp. SBI8L]KZM43553.1 membrane protein [Marinomonas sp. SBI22]